MERRKEGKKMDKHLTMEEQMEGCGNGFHSKFTNGMNERRKEGRKECQSWAWRLTGIDLVKTKKGQKNKNGSSLIKGKQQKE